MLQRKLGLNTIVDIMSMSMSTFDLHQYHEAWRIYIAQYTSISRTEQFLSRA